MSDRLAPSIGLLVDQAGNITYDFAGHVHAEGVDLDAEEQTGGGVVPLGGVASIAWHRADGGVVAALGATHQADDPSVAQLALRATRVAGFTTLDGGRIDLNANATPAGSNVMARAGNFSAKLMDAAGGTDLLLRNVPIDVDSGTLTPGAVATASIVHNLNLGAARLVGALENITNGEGFTWAYWNPSTNITNVAFRNAGAANGRVILHGWLQR